jgi:hypothetical protein
MSAVNEDELGSLLELPVIRACLRKWNLGRAAHGPVFEGDPLEELYGELADALNYADQLEMEGEDVDEIRRHLCACAEQTRAIWKRRMGLGHA